MNNTFLILCCYTIHVYKIVGKIISNFCIKFYSSNLSIKKNQTKGINII